MKTGPLLLALLAALSAAPAVAQNSPQSSPQNAPQGSPSSEAPLQVFRDTDPAMTCAQIADEAAALSATMGGSQGGGVFRALGDVARSGAALLIPGAGLAIAGADAMTRPDREREQARAQAVQNRWYYLNGLYTGLRCNEVQASAAPTPPPEPLR